MNIVFDMDGTIADLYGVENWLNDLENSNTRPYEEAKPLWNMQALNGILKGLQEMGNRIIIVSWVCKSGTNDYNRQVRKAKKAWLNKYNFPYDEIHLVKYGTKKNTCVNEPFNSLLIDDNIKVLKGWTGQTINAKEENVLVELAKLL